MRKGKGSGSGAGPLTNGSGKGRSNSMRIRIPNTAYTCKTITHDLFSKNWISRTLLNSVTNPYPHHFWQVESGIRVKSRIRTKVKIQKLWRFSKWSSGRSYGSVEAQKWSRRGSEDGTGSIIVKSRKRKRIRIRIYVKNQGRIWIRTKEKGRIRVLSWGWRSEPLRSKTYYATIWYRYLCKSTQSRLSSKKCRIFLLLDKTTGTILVPE